jgi:hypothetical protein
MSGAGFKSSHRSICKAIFVITTDLHLASFGFYAESSVARKNKKIPWKNSTGFFALLFFHVW